VSTHASSSDRRRQTAMIAANVGCSLDQQGPRSRNKGANRCGLHWRHTMSFTRIARAISAQIYRLAMVLPPDGTVGIIESRRDLNPSWSRVRGAASEPHCLAPTSTQ
jgi:hypothetical protein